MQLKTYLIYCLILYLVLVIRTLLYIEKEKTRRAEKGDRRNRKRENQGEGCRRPIARSSPLLLLRLLPPLSSTSPDAHPSPARNIAKGEGRTVTPSASGRCHRHTSPPPRHRSTSNQQRQGSASTVCHPAHLVLFPVLFHPSGGNGKSEQKSKQKRRKRENQGEGCRRPLRPFIASLLLRLLPPLSSPSPAAHRLTRSQHRQG